MLRRWRAAGWHPQKLVIALGTNNINATNAYWDGEISRAMKGVGPDIPVYWVRLGLKTASDSRVAAGHVRYLARRPQAVLITEGVDVGVPLAHVEVGVAHPQILQISVERGKGYSIRNNYYVASLP